MASNWLGRSATKVWRIGRAWVGANTGLLGIEIETGADGWPPIDKGNGEVPASEVVDV